jgi:hypothetical protein
VVSPLRWAAWNSESLDERAIDRKIETPNQTTKLMRKRF